MAGACECSTCECGEADLAPVERKCPICGERRMERLADGLQSMSGQVMVPFERWRCISGKCEGTVVWHYRGDEAPRSGG